MFKPTSHKLLLFVGACCGVLFILACRHWTSTSQAAPGAGKLTGRAQDEQHKPLADVTIVIKDTTSSEPFPEIAPVTNAQGEFAFPALPVGSYTLLATREGFQQQTQTATVKEGQPARVEFTLRRAP